MAKNTKNLKVESKKTGTKKDVPKKILSKVEKKPSAKQTVKSAAKASAMPAIKASAKKSEKKPSIVAKGHLVSVEYIGTLDNGEEFDNSKNHGPIKFIVGGSQVIKGFNDAMVGMKLNDQKKLKIAKENAYGDINPALMHKVPLAKLPTELKDKVKVGGFLMLQSPVGQQIPAKVVSIDKENITLDMNHPLAGKNLTFDIKLVDISIPETHDCKDGDCKDGECGDNCNC